MSKIRCKAPNFGLGQIEFRGFAKGWCYWTPDSLDQIMQPGYFDQQGQNPGVRPGDWIDIAYSVQGADPNEAGAPPVPSYFRATLLVTHVGDGAVSVALGDLKDPALNEKGGVYRLLVNDTTNSDRAAVRSVQKELLNVCGQIEALQKHLGLAREPEPQKSARG